MERFYICIKGERLVLKLNRTGIYIQRASLLSLPCSHHSCFHPRCMRLPSPSLVAPLWRLASAAAASPAGRRLALPRTQRAWAQRTRGILFWARGRVRQKGRKALQTADPANKTRLHWRELIHRPQRTWTRAAIDLLLRGWKIYTLILPVSAPVCHHTQPLIYFRNSRHVSWWCWW